MPEESQQPVCMCFILPKDETCPVHGLDRSQTTDHPSRKPRESDRVVNTSTSLRQPK